MDAVQQELFGSFPRRVGTPNQFWVFSEAQFDHFLDTVAGTRNAYATVSRLPIEGSGNRLYDVEADKVLYDFDGDKSALPDNLTPDESVALMRDDPDVADAVLGDAVVEARRLVERSAKDGVPTLGVFSGFGIHIHQLYQPTTEGVRTKMASTARRYIDTLDLTTADQAVVGDDQRICRIPNVQRCTNPGPRGTVEDGRPAGLWTIPLDAVDLQDMDVQWLLDRSTGEKGAAIPSTDSRPEMDVFTDYVDDLVRGEDGVVAARPIETRDDDTPDEDVRTLLEELIRMPCMVERLDQPNPSHTVRVNGAVMLFNVGLTVQEVVHLFTRLNWTDMDRQTTEKHLRYIYKKGYSDQNCSTLRRKGLCVKEDPVECRTYGWSGGQAEWKT